MKKWPVTNYWENLREIISVQVNISNVWTSITKVLKLTGFKLILSSGEEPKIAAYLKKPQQT